MSDGGRNLDHRIESPLQRICRIVKDIIQKTIRFKKILNLIQNFTTYLADLKMFPTFSYRTRLVACFLKKSLKSSQQYGK